MKIRIVLGGIATILGGLGLGYAGTMPMLSQGSTFVPGATGDFNGLIQSMNQQMPGYASLGAGRNILDNGAMQIAARGTGAATGAAAAGCVAVSYSADRWCVDTNVTSGAGFSQVITATPSPPPGFKQSVKVYRNSGALLQPICFMQEIESAKTIQLQGQAVMLSAYVQGLAGNTATTALTAKFVTGTGTDEGVGALRGAVGMTASPATTPALTGLASASFAAASASPTWNVGTTAAWSRIYSAPLPIPATATEAVVEICTTPVGSSSGVTDGFAITGVQLEVVDGNQNVPSAFELLPIAVETARAERFYYEIAEPAASISVGPSGQGASTTTCILSLPHPQEMQLAPIFAVRGTALANTTWTVTHVVTNTALSTPFMAATTGGHTTRMLNLTATTGAALTVGQTCTLTGAGGGNIVTVSADF